MNQSKLYPPPAVVDRLLRGFEQADDSQAGLAVEDGRARVLYRIQELGADVVQRLGRVELGNPHVAGAVADQSLVGLLFVAAAFVAGDALVVDANLLGRLDVVVDDHAAAAGDERAAGFEGREPVEGEVGDQRVVEAELHVGDVLKARLDVATAGRHQRCGLAPDDVIHDGEVVRGQVPDDVNVVLEESEVDADGVEVEKVADLARRDQLLDAAHRARVEEGVVNHQGEAARFGQRDQFFGLADAGREGLFDEDVLARFERGTGERVVRGDGRGDDNGVEAGGGELPVIGRSAGRRVAARDFFQPPRVAAADPPERRRLVLGEVAYQVRPPVAAADDPDCDAHP